MEALYKTSLFITIIGGLNWGLIALFNFNLVTTITGDSIIGSNIIYILIAICSLISIGLISRHFELDEKKL